jgi:hypothetical protein
MRVSGRTIAEDLDDFSGVGGKEIFFEYALSELGSAWSVMDIILYASARLCHPEQCQSHIINCRLSLVAVWNKYIVPCLSVVAKQSKIK